MIRKAKVIRIAQCCYCISLNGALLYYLLFNKQWLNRILKSVRITHAGSWMVCKQYIVLNHMLSEKAASFPSHLPQHFPQNFPQDFTQNSPQDFPQHFHSISCKISCRICGRISHKEAILKPILNRFLHMIHQIKAWNFLYKIKIV